MAADDHLKRIVAELERAKKPVGFCVSGSFDFEGTPIAVDGIGPIKLPVRPAGIRKLCEAAVQAPYGKRTQTIVDRQVRDTLEIPASAISVADGFREQLNEAIKQVAHELHLEEERLECELYKLLIYTKGGFFLPHRDSEKRKGMVASMVVVLPNKFSGGALIVQHEGHVRPFTFGGANNEAKAEFVAFFSDCKHEVERVTSGVRLCLTFNLILKPASKPSVKQQGLKSNPMLWRSIKGWIGQQAEKPIVFAFEHLYTSDGLVPDLLKGTDAKLYKELLPVAEELDCSLHFGQVSRHLCQYADDGDFEYRRGRNRRSSGDYSELNIGDVYDDEIEIDGWKDAQGKSKRLPGLPCEPCQLISATPVEKWIPTKQEYEGYTGNAGNTLDRWYHKSALVLWPNDQRFKVMTQMGLKYAIEKFLGMVAGRSKLKGEKRDLATADCVGLANAIIGDWPERMHGPFDCEKGNSPQAEFAKALPTLEDLELVGAFLRVIARKDRHFDLTKCIRIALDLLGTDPIFPLIEELLLFEPQPNRYGKVFNAGLMERDAVLLRDLAKSNRFSDDSRFTSFLKIAYQKLVSQLKELEAEDHHVRSDPSATIWEHLSAACILSEDETVLQDLLRLTDRYQQIFELRRILVPAAIRFKKLKLKRLKRLPDAVVKWIATIEQKMKSETESTPQPPRDQTRNADTKCRCEYCGQLSRFLSDPVQSQLEILAAEHHRDHMERVIEVQKLDVDSKKIRVGNRYALRFSKTTSSYLRSLKQYEADLKLLASLNSI